MNTNAQLDPKIWGSHVWATMHVLALNESKNFGAFLDSLELLLPCKKCQMHFQEYKTKNPLTGNNFEWTVNFHNAVNIKLGRSTMTVEDARKQWASDSCSYSCEDVQKPDKTKTILYGIILSILFILLIIVMRKQQARSK